MSILLTECKLAGLLNLMNMYGNILLFESVMNLHLVKFKAGKQAWIRYSYMYKWIKTYGFKNIRLGTVFIRIYIRKRFAYKYI